MKIIDVKQGTEAWREARLGLATASMFDHIITPGGEPSKQAESYVCRVVAERLIGEPCESYESMAMQRGSALEHVAARWYAQQHPGLPVIEVGLCRHDELAAGCSPDRLVGEDGLLEIKCPMAPTVVSYACSGRDGNKYRPQVQGQLWITGRRWCDVLYFHHDFPVVKRMERDESYIQSLEKAVRDFCAAADLSEEFMREKYYRPSSFLDVADDDDIMF